MGRHSKELFPLWIFHPHEPIRVVWDAVLTTLMIFFLFEIPIQICFELRLRENHAWTRADLAIDMFLISDIVFNFHTGYFDDRFRLVSARKQIAVHYLKGGFIIDLITSLPIQYAASYGHSQTFQKIVKLIWIAYLVRLVRLLRVMRLLSKWETHCNTRSKIVRLRFAKLGTVVLVLAHSGACVWVGIANWYRHHDRTYENFNGYPEHSWIVRYENTWEQPELIKYLRALYFCYTTLTTVGYGDIGPLLPLEMVFTIFLQLCGCSLFAFLIANASSMVAGDDQRVMMIKEKIDAVREYISYRKLPAELAHRIRRHYGDAWSRNQVYKEDEIMMELPQSLREECVLFVHQELIRKIPTLSHLGKDIVPYFVSRLKPSMASEGDEVVSEGLLGNEMYFVFSGTLAITVADYNTHSKKKSEEFDELKVGSVESGDFFAGYAVVLDIVKHPASVFAESYCDLFVLSRSEFHSFQSEFPHAAAHVFFTCKQKYVALIQTIQKERKHRAELLSLMNARVTDILGSNRGNTPQQDNKTAVSKKKLIQENIRETFNPDIEFAIRSKECERLQFEMRSAPVISFGMRLKYHKALKEIKKYRDCAGNLTPTVARAKPKASSKISDLFGAGLSYEEILEDPNFPIGIVHKILAWRDRARLRIVERKFESLESELGLSFQENHSQAARTKTSTFVFPMNKSLRPSNTEISEEWKGEFSDVGELGCDNRCKQERAHIKTELQDLRKLVEGIAFNQKVMMDALVSSSDAQFV